MPGINLKDANSITRKPTRLFTKDSTGTTRKLKSLWMKDVNGVSRKIFSSYDCRVQILNNTGGTYATENGAFYIDVEANGSVGPCYTDILFYFDSPFSRLSPSSDLILITGDASLNEVSGAFFRASTLDDVILDTEVINHDGIQTWHIATGFTNTLSAFKLRAGFTAQGATAYLRVSISSGNIYVNDKQINRVELI